MPRSLADALHRSFSHSSRTRGETYFWDGRVSDARADGGTFSATVSGTREYQSTLTLEANRLVAECTCPYFVDVRQPCKHIWAVVLVADEAKAFTVPAGLWLDVDAGVDFDELGDPLPVTTRLSRPSTRNSALSPPKLRPIAAPASPPPWTSFLKQVTTPARSTPAHTLPRGELIYAIDVARSGEAGGLLVEILNRERRKSGEWGRPKPANLDRHVIARLPDERDRRLLDAIVGAEPAYAYSAPAWSGYQVGLLVPSAVVLNATLQRELGPALCETGRLMLRLPAGTGATPGSFVPIDWDPVTAGFRLRVRAQADSYTISGSIERGGTEYALDEVLFVTSALMLWRPTEPGGHAHLAAFDPGSAQQWVEGLLKAGAITVPAAGADALAEALASADLARLDCPDELRVETHVVTPRPMLRIKRSHAQGGYSPSFDRLDAALTFLYGDLDVDAWSDATVVFDRERRRAFRRDRSAERDAIARLPPLGVRMMADWQTGGTRLDLAESSLPTLVRVLIGAGWRVEAEGRVYRSPGTTSLDVR
jgi:hypothetical protein